MNILPHSKSYESTLVRVTKGAWAGWQHWMPSDPFEDHVGPFFMREDAQGVVCGFQPGPQCCNSHGIIHGGALMTFADFALFMIPAGNNRLVHGVTVTMNAEFLSPALADQILTARGALAGGGRRLIFVRGTVFSADTPVLAFFRDNQTDTRLMHATQISSAGVILLDMAQ